MKYSHSIVFFNILMKVLPSGCADGVLARTDAQTFGNQASMSKSPVSKANRVICEYGRRVRECGSTEQSAFIHEDVCASRHFCLSESVAKRLCGRRACTHGCTDIWQPSRYEQKALRTKGAGRFANTGGDCASAAARSNRLSCMKMSAAADISAFYFSASGISCMTFVWTYSRKRSAMGERQMDLLYVR